MACNRTGDKLLSEPMTTESSDAYVQGLERWIKRMLNLSFILVFYLSFHSYMVLCAAWAGTQFLTEFNQSCGSKWAWAKWLTLCRQYIWMHFVRKFGYDDWNFIEVCCCGSNWQWFSTDSSNCLVSSRRQSITQTSGDLVLWCHMMSLGHNELRKKITVVVTNKLIAWHKTAVTPVH